jgi:Na+-translocating ferredoxin:NAD+ oxidoreductase RnfG subunit
MLKKILAVIAAIGSALSAIFFVLFKQAKEEKKAINEKYDNMKENLDALTEADKAANKVRKDNEELKKKINSSNTLDSFNACNELLSK